MVGESNQNVFFVQKDALRLAEFEKSEFEISRVDCSTLTHCRQGHKELRQVIHREWQQERRGMLTNRSCGRRQMKWCCRWLL